MILFQQICHVWGHFTHLFVCYSLVSRHSCVVRNPRWTWDHSRKFQFKRFYLTHLLLFKLLVFQLLIFLQATRCDWHRPNTIQIIILIRYDNTDTIGKFVVSAWSTNKCYGGSIWTINYKSDLLKFCKSFVLLTEPLSFLFHTDLFVVFPLIQSVWFICFLLVI